MARFRSQVAQSLHYFARPHASIRRTPFTGPAAWRGDELTESDWLETFSEADIAEIDAALDASRRVGRPVADLTREDFPLSGLSDRIARWRRQLQDGRGFVVLRGLPVDRWPLADTERFYWCFGLHLGIPGAQNPQGDLLGHVRDTGAPMDGSVRQYRTREDIDFHCDLADVVGLLCLHAATEGGRSCIASSVYAYNEVLRRRPDLVDRLYAPMRMDTKGEGKIPWIPIEPCRHADGHLRTFWHGDYFRSVQRYPDAPPLDAAARQLLDVYSEILGQPGVALQMDLRPGDIQLLSNHTIVHGRTGFTDGVHPRHLLRLWLSLPHETRWATRVLRERSRVQILGRLARMRARGLLGRHD